MMAMRLQQQLLTKSSRGKAALRREGEAASATSSPAGIAGVSGANTENPTSSSALCKKTIQTHGEGGLIEENSFVALSLQHFRS
mmetsp:Transcript_49998/g.106376  ORF Transcript_49998/g.106376 Transcript_49998/m.106376 type:complete len:84 (-) Transcript_49998:233-484(-)